ncbi:MAG: hypothetical protein ACRC0X_08660, partial [Brevinema sp.]
MFTKIKEILIMIIGISILVFFTVAFVYALWLQNLIIETVWVILFLIVGAHYLYTMGNQSIFYGYFQSWEWKPAWKDNNLRRMAGEHQHIIKSSLINFVVVLSLVIGVVYTLYHYQLLLFYPFDRIDWFDQEGMYAMMIDRWTLPAYWLILLGFPFYFFGTLIYYSRYLYTIPKKAPFALESRKTMFEKYPHFFSSRNTYIFFLIAFIILGYSIFSTPVHLSLSGGGRFPPITIPFVVVLGIPFYGFKYHIKWLAYGGIFIFLTWLLWLLVVYISYPKEYAFVVTAILKWIIPLALIGTVLIIGLCFGVLLWSWCFRKKDVDHEEYDEFNKKMKPWLGFNGRFVSESFINGELPTLEELYLQTYPKKKYLFWVEYFFANMLNQNVKTLLQQKKLLWFKFLFNLSAAIDIANYYEVSLFEDMFEEKKSKKLLEVQETVEKSRIEDIEGDVFLNLELEGVENQAPSIWLPFYVSGIIYLNVVPYFLVYNTIMLVVFTKLADILTVMLPVFGAVLHGWIGLQILIIVGFLFSIFSNNVGVWLSWKKYYRLKEEEDTMFFAIFKQRILYQYIYEYIKTDMGEVVTNNYKLGYYPQMNIEIIDRIAKELSPNNYALYNKAFPLY